MTNRWKFIHLKSNNLFKFIQRNFHSVDVQICKIKTSWKIEKNSVTVFLYLHFINHSTEERYNREMIAKLSDNDRLDYRWNRVHFLFCLQEDISVKV